MDAKITLSFNEEIITKAKQFADSQVTSGDISGYLLQGLQIKSMESLTMHLKNQYRKFQLLKKTFLNGPLKDNGFIQKKGKHYA